MTLKERADERKKRENEYIDLLVKKNKVSTNYVVNFNITAERVLNIPNSTQQQRAMTTSEVKDVLALFLKLASHEPIVMSESSGASKANPGSQAPFTLENSTAQPSPGCHSCPAECDGKGRKPNSRLSSTTCQENIEADAGEQQSRANFLAELLENEDKRLGEEAHGFEASPQKSHESVCRNEILQTVTLDAAADLAGCQFKDITTLRETENIVPELDILNKKMECWSEGKQSDISEEECDQQSNVNAHPDSCISGDCMKNVQADAPQSGSSCKKEHETVGAEISNGESVNSTKASEQTSVVTADGPANINTASSNFNSSSPVLQSHDVPLGDMVPTEGTNVSPGIQASVWVSSPEKDEVGQQREGDVRGDNETASSHVGSHFCSAGSVIDNKSIAGLSLSTSAQSIHHNPTKGKTSGV